MIQFKNGHSFDFGCSSGALAFNGRGWWYDKPALWTGLLRPQDFTIITKTLTCEPITGNYRWWCPWRSVRPYKGGMINAVALTNHGYPKWHLKDYPVIQRMGYKVIVSIMPFNVQEASIMAESFENTKDIVGLQINASCPNVSRNHNVEYICKIVKAVLDKTTHPVIVKLSWQDDYLSICKELDGLVAAFELINTVPWNVIYPSKPSPLTPLGGGISGPEIQSYAREALNKVNKANIQTPIISGGGIDSYKEVLIREWLGASGFVFGTLFMYQPWKPNRIIKEYRKRGKLD